MKHIVPNIISRVVNLRLRFESRQKGEIRVGRDVEGLHHVAFAGRNAVGRGTVFAGNIKIGYATTIGANNYLHGPLTVGNYCQFAPSVGAYGKDHPLSYASTYVNQNLFDGRLKAQARTENIAVGHDVWIGHGAVLLKGVQIGNGAVIAAGAVVTSSVPDYAIAVGNPARVLRFRFAPEVIALFQRLEWWLLKPHELAELEGLFHLDFNKEPEKGISKLTEIVKKRKGKD